MKTVLILAYDFPPYVSVGGLRPYSWYKYLSGFEIYPVVVKRQWQETRKDHLDYILPGESDETIVNKTVTGTLLRTPYHPNFANRLYLKYGERRFRILRKAVTAFYELAQYFFPTGPKIEIYRGADEFLRHNKVDAIVATGDPFVLFHYASRLSKKYGIPWLADYRDPWSESMDLQNRRLLKSFHSFVEKRTLKNVAAVVTVSDFVTSRAHFPKNVPSAVIPNGYDPEAVAGIDLEVQESDVFSIGLAGSIFNWHPIHSFLTAYADFVKATPGVATALNFYGINTEEELRQLLETDFPELKTHVHFFPRMANAELLPLLAKNNAFLLFNYYSFMGTKIYDYLALRRNILLCYSNDEKADELKRKFFTVSESEAHSGRLQEELIRETGAGYVLRDEAHLKNLLPELYREFREKKSLFCDPRGAEVFSREKLTGELARIIRELT